MKNDEKVIRFEGFIPFPIKGQEARNKWEQQALQRGIENGMGASQQLRFVCRIATDANEVFSILETSEGVFMLNPKSKAQFGRNANGNAYLTVGLVGETGERYRLQWEGDAVPSKMKEVAVKHDEGKKVRAVTVRLDLSKAQVWKLGETAPRKRTRNDVTADGKPYPRPQRRNHDRLCSADLA